MVPGLLKILPEEDVFASYIRSGDAGEDRERTFGGLEVHGV